MGIDLIWAQNTLKNARLKLVFVSGKGNFPAWLSVLNQKYRRLTVSKLRE